MPSSLNLKRLPAVCLPVLAFGVLLLIMPAVSQETAVDDETCLACHDGYEAGLADGPHRLGAATPHPEGAVNCVSCHEGGAVHADDPSADNILNPAKSESSRTLQVCTSCHDPHREPSGVAYDHLMKAGVACTSCHTVHQGSSAEGPGQVCGQCHVAMTSQFASTSNHPVIGDELGCLDCHSVGAQNMPHQVEGLAVDCASCHQDYSGPYLYEHDAAWSFATEGNGCISCHDPHGSVNDRLLRQPANDLCSQCHGTPPAHRTAHNGLATGYDCIECHSAVHGSNTHRSLLDPRLGTIIGDGPDGCYCHNVIE